MWLGDFLAAAGEGRGAPGEGTCRWEGGAKLSQQREKKGE